MKIYNQIEFFEQLMLPDMKKMVEQHLHYYAFSIVCQGIELLGAAADDFAFSKYEQSETRFRFGLSEFFKDVRYRNNQTKFFKFLRGPLVHQLRPGEGIFLASVAKDAIDPERHLQNHESGALILVMEPFLADFEEAVGRFKKRMEANRVQSSRRFTEPFITVTTLGLEYGQTKWDPALGRTVTFTPAATGGANL